MNRIYALEPLVTKALIENPATRSDNFLLYIEVLKHFVDVKEPLSVIFIGHKELGIPSLESITRCRRKLQERDSSLRPTEAMAEIRAVEEKEMEEYAVEDKQWY